jgi:hypothetical protein
MVTEHELHGFTSPAVYRTIRSNSTLQLTLALGRSFVHLKDTYNQDLKQDETYPPSTHTS